MSKGLYWVAAFLFIGTDALADDVNYCHDAETNSHWQKMRAQNPQDSDIQQLSFMRDRLCRQIDDGKISVREATELFEYERETIIKKRIEYNRKLDEQRSAPLAG